MGHLNIQFTEGGSAIALLSLPEIWLKTLDACAFSDDNRFDLSTGWYQALKALRCKGFEELKLRSSVAFEDVLNESS
jgi:hypothetical protein